MKALNKKVIVEAIVEEIKSESGIVIDSNKKSGKGVIISIGKDNTDDIKIGDTVYFHDYAGKQITIDNKDYILLNQDELYCVL